MYSILDVYSSMSMSKDEYSFENIDLKYSNYMRSTIMRSQNRKSEKLM